MSNQRTLSAGSFLGELFRLGVYKRNQGRIARQVSCAVVWVVAALGGWRAWMTIDGETLQYVVGGAILVVGVWFGYRIVNVPQFADFLIAVEAEMNKVSWPTRSELVRSAAVVIIVIFLLAVILFGYDLFWRSIFVFIGVRPG